MSKPKNNLEDRSYHPFIIIDLRILDLPLTTEAFRMYGELKRYANKEGECFPSYTRLAKIYKGSYPEGHDSTLRRKAIASVQELIDWGLLIKEKRELNDGSPATNLYILTPPNHWKDSSSAISETAHRKRSKKKGSSPTELGVVLPRNQGSSPTELGVVLPRNQGSSPTELGGSSPTELRSSASSTLTRSKKLDPISLTRSKELDPEKDPSLSPQKGESAFEEQSTLEAEIVETEPQSIVFKQDEGCSNLLNPNQDKVSTSLALQNSSSRSNVPACENDSHYRKAVDERYTAIYDDGKAIPRHDLIAWAKARLGDLVKAYRVSGVVLSSRENDIETDFALFVSERNVRRGQEVTIQHGRNQIKKWERTPDDWDNLRVTVQEWLASKVTGDRKLNLSERYQEANKPLSATERIAARVRAKEEEQRRLNEKIRSYVH